MQAEPKYQDNIMNYLKWRGDLTLDQSPFNEVDALILAEMSYVSFDSIVPEAGEKSCITIARAAELFRERNSMEQLEADVSFIRMAPFVLFQMAKCRRFADMTLSQYARNTDYDKVEQFAALHINIGKGITYIAFRGTDDELIGWKENFNMSFMMPVPSQEAAVDYLNKTATGLFKKYWLGGHSKGGNLAIYSGVFCNQSVQKKIQRICSFDGPGFNRRMIDDPEYKAMEEKITSYVPQSSIIGMLMEHQEEYYVVKSGESGIMQHDALSWRVSHNRFVLAEERDKSSHFVDDTLSAWLTKISPGQREQFVDALFSVLEQSGIKNMSDLTNINPKKIAVLLKTMTSMPAQSREIMNRIMKLLLEEGNRNLKRRMNSENTLERTLDNTAEE